LILRDAFVICCDVSAESDSDFLADAHELPFVDGVFDAVVATAVLEHVAEPPRVAQEIHRILRRSGLVYSEIPFMQQVHEGAYDFTRYSMSGHRRLFNTFDEVESGLVAGPGTALLWSLENFVRSFVRVRPIALVLRAVTRAAFFWLKYLDLLVRDVPAALDAASCTYFLGRRIDRGVVPDDVIVGRYRPSAGPTR
jgi:SAM-dependent methyltransferase